MPQIRFSPRLVANGASYVRFFILGTDFGRFTISSFLVVANLVFHGGFVVTSVGHRTNGKLPHTIPYPENLNFQILVFGQFTPQIEEWRGRDLSSFFGNEKLHNFILALFQETVIGPIFEARTVRGPGGPPPQI